MASGTKSSESKESIPGSQDGRCPRHGDRAGKGRRERMSEEVEVYDVKIEPHRILNRVRRLPMLL